MGAETDKGALGEAVGEVMTVGNELTGVEEDEVIVGGAEGLATGLGNAVTTL